MKNKTSKYCIWNFRKNLEAKLKSWGRLFNFFETAWFFVSSASIDPGQGNLIQNKNIAVPFGTGIHIQKQQKVKLQNIVSELLGRI